MRWMRSTDKSLVPGTGSEMMRRVRQTGTDLVPAAMIVVMVCRDCGNNGNPLAICGSLHLWHVKRVDGDSLAAGLVDDKVGVVVLPDGYRYHTHSCLRMYKGKESSHAR